MDAARSPGRVLRYHAEDQLLDLLRRLSFPDRLPDFRNQFPVHLKASSLPPHDRLQLDDDERLLPSWPESTNDHPEELVGHV
jgi:hypothetical protein